MRQTPNKCIVLAAAAHPDDIEFTMAGSLALLAKAGAEIHIWNLANGCLGSNQQSRHETATTRWQESRASAAVLDATIHEPLFDDLAIFYDGMALARVSAVVRRIRPNLILTHPLLDYMEDHQNCARLIVTAAFSRGMKNHLTRPQVAPYAEPVALYHAMPHGLKGPLGGESRPTHFVNISTAIGTKRKMLAAHQSQKEWLDASQGMNAYLDEIDKAARRVGHISGRFRFAEAFVRHNPLGFSEAGWDPFARLLGSKCSRVPSTRRSSQE